MVIISTFSSDDSGGGCSGVRYHPRLLSDARNLSVNFSVYFCFTFADFVDWMLNCPWLTVFCIPDWAHSQNQWSNLLSHPQTLSHPGMA